MSASCENPRILYTLVESGLYDAREIVEGNPTVRVFVFHKGNYSLLALKRRKKATA